MKRFNWIAAGTLVIYFCLSILVYFFFQNRMEQENLRYKVEINEVMKGLEKEGYFFKPDLHEMIYIRKVTFLPAQAAAEIEEKNNEEWESIQEFYRSSNGTNSSIRPFFIKNQLRGYVRFDYISLREDESLLWILQGILVFCFFSILAVLLFIKYKILKPFHSLSDMPYELSKGHLQLELEENKNRFFGKFIWGIAMLRDALDTSKSKELKLERDKKMLLLSLSHDIKIPLSTIKLYAKALREGVYDSEEKRAHAVRQIENHALEIEGFVKEIITTSSEDILAIEVQKSEFYLKDYIEKFKKYYEPKCRLIMTRLYIGDYGNRLLKGDMERAFEVMENLIENAFKYGDGQEISIDFYEEDYYQIIRVFNTGKPIEAGEMPHLFDSFYRGSNVGNKEGNGLGLYISRQIMMKMEGDIFAERKEDGMSFCLVFRM